MQISAKFAMIASAVFALVCLGFAVSGFTSLGEISDPQQASDAKGFAWFWTFLASIAVVFGLVSWWIGRTSPSDDADA